MSQGRFFMLLLCFSLLIFWPASIEAQRPQTMAGLHDSPLFYEMFQEGISDSSNLSFISQGRLAIPPFKTINIQHFKWAKVISRNRSWILRLQDFKYLLPLIESSDPAHRTFCKRWFLDWHRTNQGRKKPIVGAWESMSSAIRVMVLIRFLKKEELRAPPDTRLIAALRSSIRRHQNFLARDANFDDNSNHGIFEAIGLFETTRVFPRDKIRDLALRRLMYITKKSITPLGTHREHAPTYHYVFLGLALNALDYLSSINGLAWDGLPGLEHLTSQMLAAAYFLQDHHGSIPTIGDSDETHLGDRFIKQGRPDAGAMFYDPEGGYSIYKDPPGSDNRRYVVFNIQNQKPLFPFHFHNDALAVYFNYDGEMIWSDQGKYSYTNSHESAYFSSAGAHNLIVPPAYLEPATGLGLHKKRGGILLARTPWTEAKPDQVVFGASISGRYEFNPDIKLRLFENAIYEGTTGQQYDYMFSRRVVIPKGEPCLVVEDSIGGNSPAVLIWNIGPDVETIQPVHSGCRPDQGAYEWNLVTQKGVSFKMTVEMNGPMHEDGPQALVKKGETDPVFGWYSPDYLVKVPSTVILILLKDPEGVIITTRLTKVN